MQRGSRAYDVVIVGGGPAGLSAAIRLKQIAASTGRTISVCVIEKAAETGAHILSGAVLDPRALTELLPGWQQRAAPHTTSASGDRLLLLTERRAWALPVPPPMRNQGNVVVSLGEVVRWLGRQADALGVEIRPGCAGAELLFGDNGRVAGVVAGDFGIRRDGTSGPAHRHGPELRAPYTLLAEGCRGSLTGRIETRFDLRAGHDPQTYALGIKELWELAPGRHRPGLVLHTICWPLTRDVFGGGFLYHWGERFLSFGLVIGLDYPNPYLSPFQEAQRLKTHPAIRTTFEGARRVGYGARALTMGAVQSIPDLVFPGGAIIGCAAGFMDVARLKGAHTAMKSGICAAEAVAEALAGGGHPAVLDGYPKRLRASWVWPELHAARNIRPGFRRFGLWGGLLNAAVETCVTRGAAPWTLKHRPDHEQLRRHVRSTPIDYPAPDGVLTFDRASSVALSNADHAEDQPPHVTLHNPARATALNWSQFASTETRYCPAGVFSLEGGFIDGEGEPNSLAIDARRCLHCMACTIKDPTQNIVWTVPEGGGGPNYRTV